MANSLSNNLDESSKPNDIKETNETACFEVLSEKKNIYVTLKNAGALLSNLDLTLEGIYLVDDLYSFKTRTGDGGIGVSSKWTLILVLNPWTVDESNLELILFMSRKPLTSSASTDVVVPISAEWTGNIRLVCNDLFNSTNEADLEIRTTFAKMPSKMETRSVASMYKEGTSSGKNMGWVVWNLETINAIRALSQSRCIDLVLEGQILFSRAKLSPSPPSLIRNPKEAVSNHSFVQEWKKEWMQIGMSLLLGAAGSIPFDAMFVFPETQLKIGAHRFVLSALSPVFRKMFETEMVEKNMGEIKIEDVSAEGMNCAVKFLYTGSLVEGGSAVIEGGDLQKLAELDEKALSIWSQYAEEISHIADKYQIECLKQFCDKNFFLKCTKENAPKLYQTAELYGLEKARKEIRRYMKEGDW